MFRKDFAEFTEENTFKVADFAGEVVLAHWKSGYISKGKNAGEPYGFWEFFSVKSEMPGIGAYGKSGTIVRYSEKTPSDFEAFVPPLRKKPAEVAAAKKELPWRACDEARARRDELLKVGYKPATIAEILTKEFPPEDSLDSLLDF